MLHDAETERRNLLRTLAEWRLFAGMDAAAQAPWPMSYGRFV